MNIINDIGRADLQAAFEAATDPKAVKRLMVALAYTDGVPVDTISDRYGISRSTIYAWLHRFEEGSIADAITDDDRPGRPASLGDADRIQLATALSNRPNQHGFDTETWTPGLVQQYIHRTFDVEYSLGHARRLLREYGSD